MVMRLPLLHLTLALQSVQAFQLSTQNHRNSIIQKSRDDLRHPNQILRTDGKYRPPFALYVTQSGRTSDDIKQELTAGKLLEGGEVMDFANVQYKESKAEIALANARSRFLNSQGPFASSLSLTTNNGDRLMGINDEVVAEIGYEVGSWAANMQEDIQNCAAYLRYKSSLFSANEDASRFQNLPQSTIDWYEQILAKSYEESGDVTSAFAKTFYLGTKLMPQDAQRAIWAIYVWCRRTDEIVDAERTGYATEEEANEAMLTDLSAWEVRTERLWSHGEVVDILDLPLLDVLCKTTAKGDPLDITPFKDMIRGMLMDIPNLGQDRYQTWEELHLYCYRVAGTVGLMSMPIFGTADKFTAEDAKEPALSLGVAFQITNILRDVGEDAVNRGRVYLPRDDMAKFGVTEEQILNQQMDDNYKRLMQFEIARARKYYARAQRGVAMLAPASRLPVQSSLDCYGAILDKIEKENDYNSLQYRAYVGKWEKLFMVLLSWWKIVWM
eukprot:CAMPEP_0196812046 /NCGR_PEP_ID=MMETSP1362-20130617/20204_1 /TAXON_ID=163516 /ORGANISM="Leptocylindrus danicus, Strain CCMP1856" /LENGTH=497 /DNA_ID=CAMNT_0042187463 /DNA_START=17 /DNA_END=1510 /DNA_ORIENTATION=+